MNRKLSKLFTGASLVFGLALNSVCASNVYADINELDSTDSYSVGNFYQYWFCKRELSGDLFSRTELFFGLSKPDGTTISDSEFEAFVDAEVTPRFPDGLTQLDGSGQFLSSSGVLIKEGSKVLILLYPFSKSASAKVNEIRDAYVSQFNQESVLRTDEQNCVSF
ncbi:MAG: DUF3574 domain-containing protein [Exilibacterium sp.]